MKQASRFMPKFEPREISRSVLVAFGVVVAAVIMYKPWLLLVIALFAMTLTALGVIVKTKLERHFQVLCYERNSQSICEFAKEFDLSVVDTWVIRAAYEQVQAALPTKKIVPIKASDNLIETLKLDEEELEFDVFEEIAQRTNRSLEDAENNPYFGKVETVQDLVLFFNLQPAKMPSQR